MLLNRRDFEKSDHNAVHIHIYDYVVYVQVLNKLLQAPNDRLTNLVLQHCCPKSAGSNVSDFKLYYFFCKI